VYLHANHPADRDAWLCRRLLFHRCLLPRLTGLAVLLHEGAPLAPHDVWGAWSWEPGVLLGVAVTAGLYARGWLGLRRRSVRRSSARRRQEAAFWAGWFALVLALVSPLHRMGGALLGTALLYWWSVLTEARHRGRHGGAIVSLFTTMIYTGGLGALLTVAARPWYPAYGAASRSDGHQGPAARLAGENGH